MLARRRRNLYLTAAYADGMTEYTTNWTSFKTSAYRRDVGGFAMNHRVRAFEVLTAERHRDREVVEHRGPARSILDAAVSFGPWGSYGR